jgi:hypothetical protein
MNESLKVDSRPPSGLSLRRWLGFGAFAALVAGLLAAGSSALSLAGWQQGALNTSEFLSLASLLTLGVVLAAYWQVSLQTRTPGLRKSALGLFGVLVIGELATLNISEGNWRWWNIAIWVVLVLATALLLIVVWNLEEIEKEGADGKSDTGPEQKAEAEAAAAGTGAPAGSAQQDSKTWHGNNVKAAGVVLAALGTLGLIVLKAFVRVGVRRLMKSMDLNLFEILVLGALLVLAVVFLVWFAVVKIRLRKELGVISALAGSVELFMILLGALALGGMLLDMFQVLKQAGLNEEAMQAGFEAVAATWSRRTDIGALVVNELWALLTAGLFLNCRARLALALA